MTKQTISQNGQLDKQPRQLIQSVINQCKTKHPGGLVYSLASELGIDPEFSKMAGICAELFYAACSFTDDLQDDDARNYMGDVSLPLLINTQAHLFALSGAAANYYQKTIYNKFSSKKINHQVASKMDLCGFLFQTSSQMLNGQYFELMQQIPNSEIYLKVAYLSSGKQFSYYVLLALYPNLLAASDKNLDCKKLHNWLKWSEYYGIGLQITTDFKTKDSRLLGLSQEQIKKMAVEIKNKLEAAQALLDFDFKDVLSELYSVLARICS